MIDGLNPHGAEWLAFKRHLLRERAGAIAELVVPGQTTATYDVLRGRINQIDRLLRAAEEHPRVPEPALARRGGDSSGY